MQGHWLENTPIGALLAIFGLDLAEARTVTVRRRSRGGRYYGGGSKHYEGPRVGRRRPRLTAEKIKAWRKVRIDLARAG